MAGRRFRTTRKKDSRSVDEMVARRPLVIPPEGLTVDWLLDRLGFDPDSFWKDPNFVRFVDPQVAVETIAAAHADTGFPLFLPGWDNYDHECDGKAFTGRLIAAAMMHHGHDWPLDRSWFHDLYIDLARLDGALGLDLSSEEQLRRAVSSFWKRIGALARAHATAIRLDKASEAAEAVQETFQPLRQLALF